MTGFTARGSRSIALRFRSMRSTINRPSDYLISCQTEVRLIYCWSYVLKTVLHRAILLLCNDETCLCPFFERGTEPLAREAQACGSENYGITPPTLREPQPFAFSPVPKAGCHRNCCRYMFAFSQPMTAVRQCLIPLMFICLMFRLVLVCYGELAPFDTRAYILV